MNAMNSQAGSPAYVNTGAKIAGKPRRRNGEVYSILDREYHFIGGGEFDPTWDTTDHFHFICHACLTAADVLEVKLHSPYGGGIKYALFFYLGCPKCGATGQRKIYLDHRDDACLFQTTYIGGEVLIYGRKRQPERWVKLAGDRMGD